MMKDIDLFDKIRKSIPQRFQAERNKGRSYQVLFHFSDAVAQSFIVSIANNECTLGGAAEFEAFDCKVESSLADYIALEMGKLSPQEALMSGKLQVSDIEVMLNFSKAFLPFSTFNSQEKSKPKTKRVAKSGPLKDLLVLDFTKLLPGPLCTRILADRGADVWKVESPNSPDSIRSFPPFEADKSLFYLGLNRNKKSLEIDYQNPALREEILDWVEKADVLVEQFRPGVMQAFGLDYESLKELNPQLIYVSITGYGQKGKYANEPGHDINYLARSGVLSQLKDAEGKPFVPAIQIADVQGGAMQAVQEILFALLDCYQNDRGKHIDINMTGALAPLLTLPVLHKQGAGAEESFVLNGQHINYSIYQSKDGDYFALGALEPKFWNRFCEHIEKEEWKARVLSKDKRHVSELQSLFASKDSTYWRAIENAGDTCLTEVLDISKGIANFPEYWTQTKLGNFIPGASDMHFWDAPSLGED